MSEKISDLLSKEFGLYGFLGGTEYDSFPEWKQKAADNLLELGMTYRIAKINLVTAMEKSDQYHKAVRNYVNGTSSNIPLWAKPGRIEELLMMFETVKAEIIRTIKIYNCTSA